MPLRDHFHGPDSKKQSWDAVHGGWPMMIVQDLYKLLPAGFVAAPGVHLGAMFEIDVSTFEDESSEEYPSFDADEGEGGVAVAVEITPHPTLTLEADLSEFDEYEVRIYDDEFDRRLVAAIEIVSPSNKDRPESRRAFLTKVEALLQKDVCVSIVDLVSIKQFNLYAELLELLGREDPRLSPTPPHLYAVTLRSRKKLRPKGKSFLDVWFYPMTVGQVLPVLPIWLSPNRRILLPFESSYEETCRLLRIS